MYTSSELPDYDKWPPTQSTCYISLSVISKEGISGDEVDEFTRATLHGDVDQILKKKRSIKMEGILVTESGQKPKCVLVEGGPGVGKTTFSWEVCKRWGKGELFQEYTIVIHLSLREEWVQSAKHASDLFYYTDEEVQKQIAAEIIRANGKDMLVVLDGLDEMPSYLLRKSLLIGRLLSGKDLPLATVLVTTRPSVTEKLLRTWNLEISQHIEVLGFTKQDIQRYIDSVLPPDFLPGFMDYLSSHPHIHTMMYTPLNCAIVTEIYKHSRHSCKPAPSTATQLYKDLSHTLLLRYLDNHPEYKEQDLEINSFSDLPPPVHTRFHELCEIAYNGVFERQLVFRNLGRSFDHMGFMHSQTDTFCPRRASVTYNFPHFSIQEYLAAEHFSRMEPEEQIGLFQMYNCHNRTVEQRRLDNFWRFVFGITKLKGFELSKVKNPLILKGSQATGNITVELLYETQDTRCLDIFGNSESVVTFSSYLGDNLQLLPSTASALAYCVKHSKCTWKLYLGNFSSDAVEILIQELKNCPVTRADCVHSIVGCRPQHLKQLPLHILRGIKEGFLDMDLEYETWTTLSEVVKSNIELEELTLTHLPHSMRRRNHTAKPLLVNTCHSASKLDTLKVLHIVINDYVFTEEDAAAVKQLLQSTTCRLEDLVVKSLIARHTAFSLESVRLLSEGVSSNTTLRKLELANLPLFSASGEVLASMLTTNRTLTEFKISHSNVTYESAELLAEALRRNETLSVLDISYNKVRIEGARITVEVLDDNKGLGKLVLSASLEPCLEDLPAYHRNSHRIKLTTKHRSFHTSTYYHSTYF